MPRRHSRQPGLRVLTQALTPGTTAGVRLTAGTDCPASRVVSVLLTHSGSYVSDAEDAEVQLYTGVPPAPSVAGTSDEIGNGSFSIYSTAWSMYCIVIIIIALSLSYCI